MSGESFGGFLKDLRVRYGYKTQKQLADASGVSQTTLSRIEAGTQRPQPETLRVLAEHLRPYTYGELMEQAGYFDGLDSSDKEFIVDLFDESEDHELEEKIFTLIDALTTNGQFNISAVSFLKTELGPMFESEGWSDIEYTPDQFRQLTRELDSNAEYKLLLYNALKRVLQLSEKSHVDTLAAHHEGEDWTEEELEEIERFKEFVRMKRQQKGK